MNKTDKRQLNLRNKLLAAIAMLLVSSIMMVSSTYAWFTLSTAPEVQGITTTVGANGNLEIALSPYSGNAADITSAMGDSGKDWAIKNLTWGNLLNLSDNSTYGLDKIALLPAKLNITADKNVAASPLLIPSYGADGRPSMLDSSSIVIGSKWDYDETNAAYVQKADFVSNNTKGIRVIGTSEDMSEWEATFNSAINALASDISSTKSSAQNSLINHGDALAGIIIDYNLDSGANLAKYVPELGEVLAELNQANNYLLSAVRNALIADASDSVDFSDAQYSAAKALPTAATAENITAVQNYITTYNSNINGNIKNAMTTCVKIVSDLTLATTAYESIENNDTVSFDNITGVLNYIMKTTGVKVNGVGATAGKEAVMNAIVADMQNIKITLPSESGVYADFGSVVGNLYAPIKIAEVETGTSFGTLSNVSATIITESEPAGGAYLVAARTAIVNNRAYAPEGEVSTDSVISVPYAYIVDFFFRTNASGSQLKLQTQGIQRVYEDSTSTATLGNGSTMTFAISDKLNAEATARLMESIRVVFMDTASGAIYGMGKLDMSNYITRTTENNTTVVTYSNLDGATELTAPLYLYEIVSKSVVTGEGESQTTTTEYSVSDNKIADENAYLCSLNANEAKAVSALVYLDGESVTNADVAANGTSSATGTLNLQFASDADLIPMENNALKNMTEAGQYNVTLNVAGQDMTNMLPVKIVNEGESYSYTIPGSITIGENNVDLSSATISITMGGQAVNIEGRTVNIPSVTGHISITVTGVTLPTT